MANYQSTQVNETSEEENVSLEQQAAMQEEAANQRNQPIESNTDETPVEKTTEERPEWLDDKFKSPEDLAKAYNELQKKQSTKAENAEENTEEPAPSSKTSEVVSKASEDFAQNGELSDKSFVELEKAGISRDMVEA